MISYLQSHTILSLEYLKKDTETEKTQSSNLFLAQNVSSSLTYSTLSHFVEFAFDMQLRMFGFDAFQLYCHLFARGNVCAQIDVAERARAYLSTQSVSISNSQLHFLRNSLEEKKKQTKFTVNRGILALKGFLRT
jgi:hypothetical protein